MSGLRFQVDIDGNFTVWARDEIIRSERAVQRGIAGTVAAIKAEWRSQIVAAGLGSRLSRAVRSDVYPKGQNSIRAAGTIWTKAPKIISAHQNGAVIRSQDGFWLAIPLAAAGKGNGGGRITPGEWEKRRGMRLRFVYRRTGPSLLVADGRQSSRGLATQSRSKTGRGRATVPVFLLVPQVRLRKRLSLLESAERIAGSAAGNIVAAWEAA